MSYGMPMPVITLNNSCCLILLISVMFRGNSHQTVNEPTHAGFERRVDPRQRLRYAWIKRTRCDEQQCRLHGGPSKWDCTFPSDRHCWPAGLFGCGFGGCGSGSCRCGRGASRSRATRIARSRNLRRRDRAEAARRPRAARRFQQCADRRSACAQQGHAQASHIRLLRYAATTADRKSVV